MNLKKLLDVMATLSRSSAPQDRVIFDWMHKDFENEFAAYIAPRGDALSPYVIHHPQCLDAIYDYMVRKVLPAGDRAHQHGAWAVNAIAAFDSFEEHLNFIKSGGPLGKMSPIVALFNLSIWSARSGLFKMAAALNPFEGLNVEKSWQGGHEEAATAIAILRVRRANPETLYYDNPNDEEIDSLKYFGAMVDAADQVGVIVEAYNHVPPVVAPV